MTRPSVSTRHDRAIAIARAQGDLERLCSVIAKAMDAGVKPSTTERRAIDQMLREKCVALGRAVNVKMEVV